MALLNRSSFVLATNNPDKVLEIKHEFNGAGLSLISPADLGFKIHPEETGRTFEENSQLKARETFKLLKEMGHVSHGVVADDSGFEVDALGGLPGVDSSLFLGETTSYEARNAFILKELANSQNRTARFVCVLTCILPNGEVFAVRGETEGEVAVFAKGHNGFGYDPIFYLREFGKTMAELTLDEKSKISHRGKALRLLFDKLVVKNEDFISERYPWSGGQTRKAFGSL